MKKYSTIAAITLAFVAMGCSNDDDGTPQIINPEEVITTMTVTLTPATGPAVVLRSFDEDGDGPIAPINTVSGPLQANLPYTGEIVLLNASATPAENVTDEVRGEANEHQFFYVKSGALTTTFAYADKETDYPRSQENEGDAFSADPVGIKFTLNPGAVGQGTFSITLRHQPKKPNNGTLEDAVGETDFEATFAVIVE